MTSLRAVIGVIFSLILILFSIYNFMINNSLTTQVWSYLLLAPLPLAIGLAPNTEKLKLYKQEKDWDDEAGEIDNENIDPVSFGYDIPIL
ncbi:MAG: hypothetical protein HOJ64_03160 [Euryarchaeota archaeon]|jgi:hypothetical protein|nr:hypothetical protein [Euryarchaeota archaeon]MBT4391125.1 hypothetical protein [Euryarchaeota archaeon]MBT4802686.1 hypothetical protein [Euryarchaeota archaeon]MBT5613852.1 hypothetical protein [Euryarchaeota archaeon]MBT6683646.1 hypothetical protein [Euryarchaeota archaeon]